MGAYDLAFPDIVGRFRMYPDRSLPSRNFQFVRLRHPKKSYTFRWYEGFRGPEKGPMTNVVAIKEASLEGGGISMRSEEQMKLKWASSLSL